MFYLLCIALFAYFTAGLVQASLVKEVYNVAGT